MQHDAAEIGEEARGEVYLRGSSRRNVLRLSERWSRPSPRSGGISQILGRLEDRTLGTVTNPKIYEAPLRLSVALRRPARVILNA